MKRKSMLWLAIALFVAFLGLMTLYTFPKLERKLDKATADVGSLKSLDNSDLEWNGRNGYLIVPADIDKSDAELVESEIEQIQGVRDVKIIYDEKRVMSDKKETLKEKSGKFRLDWTADKREFSGKLCKNDADKIQNMFGGKGLETDSDAVIKDETIKKLEKMKPDLFDCIDQGMLEVDGEKIKVSGVASKTADIEAIKSKWNSLGNVDLDIKEPEKKEQAEQKEEEKQEKLDPDYEFINLYFETGSSVLVVESVKDIDEIANVLNKYKDVQVDIVGHTDNWGNNSSNMDLSEERSQAVMNILVDKGVDKSRINAYGMGEKQPIGNNATALGREKNRRVEILVKENS